MKQGEAAERRSPRSTGLPPHRFVVWARIAHAREGTVANHFERGGANDARLRKALCQEIVERGIGRRHGQRGVLHRLATGYYAVVPAGQQATDWRPTLEAAAYGIAAATEGPDNVVLMGLSAARLHGAIPRALAVAVVAAPRQRPPVHLVDRAAQVLFVRRDTDRLDAERVRTDLGAALVTGVEQTVLDLAHRPDFGGVAPEARAAVRALLPRSDPARLDELASQQRLRAARDRALEWAR